MQDNLDRSLVDAATMKRACERFSLPTGGALVDKIERLSGYIEKLRDNEDLYCCNKCGADMPGELVWCPFCGDESIEDEAPEDSGVGVVVLDAATIDESVVQIKSAGKAAAIGVWNLGEALRQNLDDQLWAQRLTKKGAQKYKTVNEFWTRELGYGHAYCYRLIRVARQFTYEQAAGLSERKLALILKAPKGRRDELIDGARDGQTQRQLADQIGGAKPTGRDAPPTGSDAPHIGDLVGDPAPKDDRVTVSYEPKKRVVQMLAFPEGGGQPVPATADHTCVWAKVELDNHVMHVEIALNPDEQYEMLIKFEKL